MITDILQFFKNVGKPKKVSEVKLVCQNEYGNMFSYGGNVYKSDVVRACVKPFVSAAGMLNPVHIRKTTGDSFARNPDFYISSVLADPNPIMSFGCLLERAANQFMLNNNAFIYVKRNEYGLVTGLYPINATSVEKSFEEDATLYLRFTLYGGNRFVFPYSDIIHLRRNYNNDDVFGDFTGDTLTPLLEVIAANDKSIVHAVKNGGILRWLLKFDRVLNPSDLARQAKEFERTFLTGDTIAAATDNQKILEQLKPTDYVPEEESIRGVMSRIYAYFGTNENITGAKYTEDEWTAYVEANVAPFAKQLEDEFTRKIFTKKERFKDGNKIIFETTSLHFASMSTKLGLQQMVDRGAMTANEWRNVLNLPPVEGGDEIIRRLDTAAVSAKNEKEEVKNGQK